jgi:hypothetical protein
MKMWKFIYVVGMSFDVSCFAYILLIISYCEINFDLNTILNI